MSLPFINTGRPLEAQRMTELNQKTSVWRQTLLRAELEGQAAFERYKLLLMYWPVRRGMARPSCHGNCRTWKNSFKQAKSMWYASFRLAQVFCRINVQLDLYNELAQSVALLVGATCIPLDMLIDQP